jgi:DNA-binding NarL/FixJ family response regulator
MPDPVIRVLLVDDHAMVRRGMRDFLGLHEDIQIVGEASDGVEAIERTKALRPDIVVMDLMMPGIDGVEATARIKAELPDVEIIAITSFIEEARVVAAIEAGASGFLLKDAPAEELAAAIRVVASGDSLLAPGVTRRVIDAFVRRPAAPSKGPDPALSRLTPREVEVLGLLARGLSNVDIAERLFVSEATTKTHVSNVLSKLGLRDRVQAVIFAYENGVVVPGEREASGDPSYG